MQEDCRILLPALQNTRNWCQKTWRHTRAPGFGNWLGSLPEAINPNLPSRSFESGTGTEQLQLSE
jgi:hypothetical protein